VTGNVEAEDPYPIGQAACLPLEYGLRGGLRDDEKKTACMNVPVQELTQEFPKFTCFHKSGSLEICPIRVDR
jgi:hypothetical protein